MRLALVQSDLGAAAHVGVGGPVEHEQRAFDAADFPQGGRQLVLTGIRGELAQDLARPHGPGGHGGRDAQDVRPVPVDQVRVHLAADQWTARYSFDREAEAAQGLHVEHRRSRRARGSRAGRRGRSRGRPVCLAAARRFTESLRGRCPAAAAALEAPAGRWFSSSRPPCRCSLCAVFPGLTLLFIRGFVELGVAVYAWTKPFIHNDLWKNGLFFPVARTARRHFDADQPARRPGRRRSMKL